MKQDGEKTFEEEWRERFGRFAQCYENDHLVSGWSDKGLQRRLALFAELLGKRKLPVPALVLDIGCGAGTYVRLLGGRGHHVVGLDYSLPTLHRALVADPDRLGDYIAGEAYRLPFANDSFDLVVSIGVFQTVGRPEQVLDEMTRVLRPKGLLIVEFLNAREIIAQVNAAYRWLSGQLERVRRYSPLQVSRWLGERRLTVVGHAKIYLPPRGIGWLGTLLDCKAVVYLMTLIPGVSLTFAHAFLLAGEKEVNQRANQRCNANLA